MKKKIIVGLDLSFNSSGITVGFFEDFVGQSLEFYRVIFDDQTRKRGFHPPRFKNINNVVYRMPSNLTVDEILLVQGDINNELQLTVTLKSMIVQKKIGEIVKASITKFNPDEIYFCIENYVMPSAFGGKMSLTNVSGLIILQGLIREVLIRLSLEFKLPFKMLTESPSSNKLFFTGFGGAEKEDMYEYFNKYWNGEHLLPSTTEKDITKINDVVDSFSLMSQAYSLIIKQK